MGEDSAGYGHLNRLMQFSHFSHLGLGMALRLVAAADL